MTLQVRILGCGSSGGVPRIGNNWGACDPNEVRNRRRRCSILIERLGEGGRTCVLVDASPDIREQLLDADIATVDAVVFTHDHADHTHGIDDLRVLSYNARAKVPVYMDELTANSIVSRFSYCFRTPSGSSYPPILREKRMMAHEPVEILGAGGPIVFVPFVQEHGGPVSLGLRFGRAAYSSDISGIPEASVRHVEKLDLWIVDALRYTHHPSHFSVSDALEWIERLQPGHTVLTHMHIDLDYRTLKAELPEGVEPAYDGMVLQVAEE